MMFSLEGKVVFITGGASGIGQAVTDRFIQAGARVMVADLRENEELSKLGAGFVTVDVSDEQQVANALAVAERELGKLDVVVNNAGIGGPIGTLEDCDTTGLEKVLGVNLYGVFYGLKHAPKYMNDGGSIINTASLAAQLHLPEFGPYSLSKAGVVSLTKSAAVELGPRNIRVNAVCPGSTVTPMLPDDDAEAVFAQTCTALNRLAYTDDMVGVYHFLAARESAYITGHALVVDGGWSIGVSYGACEKIGA